MEELIKQLLESVKVDLIANQAYLGIKASGKSAQSLSVQNVDESSGELQGADYFYYQIFGRGPTSNTTKGPQTLREKMVQWIKDKGITPDGISVESLAFLMARKIHREGTDIFLGTRPALDFDAVVVDNINKFEIDFKTKYAKDLSDMLNFGLQ